MSALREAIEHATLGWIKPELDAALRQVQADVDAFVETPSDAGLMRSAADQLRQVEGTLRMVELYAPAMVTEEMQLLATALAAGDAGVDRDEGCAALLRATVQLPDYLERLQSGHRDIPIVLLPLLNDMRALRSEQPLGEAVLFAPDFNRPLPDDVPRGTAFTATGNGQALLTSLHRAVSDWPVGGAPDANALVDALSGLLNLAQDDDSRRMLWVATESATAMRDGALRPNINLRDAFTAVERETRQALHADGLRAASASALYEPVRELLQQVANSGVPHASLERLRDAFALGARSTVSEEELAHARGSVTGVNRALLDTVASALKEDVFRVKDALDLHLRAGNRDIRELAPQVEALDRIGDTLGMLGLGSSRDTIHRQRDSLEQVVAGQNPASEQALLDVAGALLFVDASLEDQVARIGSEDALAPSESGGSMGASDAAHLMGALTREAVANFSDARQGFVAFVETGWDHAQLAEIPRLLDEVSGALGMLELPVPAQYLKGIRLYTEHELIRKKRVPGSQQLDTLADALASTEYYLEALRDKRADRDDILAITRQSLEALQYWPLPADPAWDEPTPVDAEAQAKYDDMVAQASAPGSTAFPESSDAATIAAAVAAAAQAPAPPAAAEPPVFDLSATSASVFAPAAPAPVFEAPAPVFEAPASAGLPPPLPAAAPAVPAAASVNVALREELGFDYGKDDIDDEIRDIFTEEFEEEIANLGQLMPAWLEKPHDPERLRPIRRVFHTLKGSGRLVGAKMLGEYSWKVENMLNRVLDGTRPASAAVTTLVGAAVGNLPSLHAALLKQPVPALDLSGVESAADRLAAGEEFMYVAPVPEAPAAVETVAVEPAAVEAPAVEAPAVELEPAPSAFVGAPWETLGGETAAIDAAPAAPEVPTVPVKVDAVLLEILTAEVGGHVATVEEWVQRSRQTPEVPDESVVRAVHTMNGAFAMAEVPEITDATAPAEAYLKRLKAAEQPVDAAGLDALAQLAEQIHVTVTGLQLDEQRVPLQSALSAQLEALRDSLPEAHIPMFDHAAAEAQALEDERITAQEREAALLEAERVEAERLEAERLAAERADAERQAAEQAEAEAARAAAERAEAERAEVERAAAAQAEAERIAAEHAEAERAAAEQAEAERLAHERAEAERVSAEQAEAERIAAEQADAERAEAQRLEAERLEAERLEAERFEAERLEAERFEAEHLASEHPDTGHAAGLSTEGMVAAITAAAVAGAAAHDDGSEAADAAVAHPAVDDSTQIFAEPLDADAVAALRQREFEDFMRMEDERLAEVRRVEDLRRQEYEDLLRMEDERLRAIRESVAVGESDPSMKPDVAELRRQEHIDFMQMEEDRLAEIRRVEDLRRQEHEDLMRMEEERLASVRGESSAESAAVTETAVPEHVVDVAPAPAAVAFTAASSIDLGGDEALDLEHIDTELLDIFLEEANDLIDNSDRLLVRLRENSADHETVGALQRDLHTLKGGARMAGIMSIGDLGHSMETLLEAVAEHRTTLGDDGVPLLERGLDTLRAMTERVSGRKQAATPHELVAQMTARARGVVHAPAAAAASTAEPAKATMAELSAPVETALDREAADAPVLVRSQEQVRIRADLLERLVNYAGEVAIYRSRLEQQLGAFRSAMGEMEQTNLRLRDQLRRLDMETEAQIVARYQREQDARDPAFDPLELDRFSTLQQLTRALNESATDLSSLQGSLEDLTRQYETLLLQQSRVSTDLQEGLMRTRMMPFEAVLPRLRRVVRQAAGDTSKNAQLFVTGAESELDRTVLERMTAPLEHVLRNALAHGIETPEARRAAGKSAEGRIVLDVRHEGSEVVLSVTDDGAGINHDAVRARAIERGLLQPGVDVSNDEIAQYILQPGFSTASEVSQLSGRGVGMDVVLSEVRQLGGTLDITSERGRNTRFILRLPQTLAVTQAVFIRIGETVYAVPIASVRGVSRIARADYAPGAAHEYGGEDYVVQDLGLLLGQQPVKAEDALQVPLLLIRSGDLRVAVGVDQIVGNREIVVKPLGPQVASIPGIFGATVMGDGSVVVILDVSPLARRYAARAAEPSLVEETPTPAAPVHVVPVVMVVDDSVTMRKVTGRVLERHGYEVMTAKDGIDALERLAERVPDIMLLDIEMPRMDGYELATAMRRDARLRDVPIMMITSRTGEKHRERAFEIGVNRYLGKPYQEPELMRNVVELLELSRDH